VYLTFIPKYLVYDKACSIRKYVHKNYENFDFIQDAGRVGMEIDEDDYDIDTNNIEVNKLLTLYYNL
jgi:hypothetical protein